MDITNDIGPIISQIISQIVDLVSRCPSVIGFFKDLLHLCKPFKSLRYGYLSKIENIVPADILTIFSIVRYKMNESPAKCIFNILYQRYIIIHKIIRDIMHQGTMEADIWILYFRCLTGLGSSSSISVVVGVTFDAVSVTFNGSIPVSWSRTVRNSRGLL